MICVLFICVNRRRPIVNKIINIQLFFNQLEMGILHSENGKWTFQYTNEFKEKGNEYNLITEFPDIHKVYQSKTLWPFFQIRIPGLKQPAIQEIIKKENIDQENEFELLKRFGYKSISNPYKLKLRWRFNY